MTIETEEITLFSTPEQVEIQNSKAKIKAAWQKSVSGIVEAGQELIALQHKVMDGAWHSMFAGKDKLPFGQETARCLMNIARHPVLSNSKHAWNLPASWYTLFVLSQLTEPRLRELIADGTVNADLHRSEAITVLDQNLKRRPAKAKAKNVLFETAEELNRPKKPWLKYESSPEPLSNIESLANDLAKRIEHGDVSKTREFRDRCRVLSALFNAMAEADDESVITPPMDRLDPVADKLFESP